MKKTEVVIVGAGVIGLAIASKLAKAGKQVLVLEANKKVGVEVSFRNSAVIHAGIYYKKDSLKAKLCVEGQKMMYDYCDAHHVGYRKTGKLIVATSEQQLTVLQELKDRAKRNGVNDLKILSGVEVLSVEPNVTCKAALYSPSTGIINGGELMMALKADVEAFGGTILVNSPLISAEVLQASFRLLMGKHGHQQTIECEYLINAAGLWAPKLAKTIKGIPSSSIPKAYYAKGNYFKFKGRVPFSRPIYPIPEQAGLGIHATIDVFGCLRFGPDVEWVENLDYGVSTDRKQIFLNAIRAYFPDLKASDIEAEFAGIRPKIKPKEEQPQDFVIQSSMDHNIKGFIALYGIESPGLTASLAIANHVQALL